MAIDAAQERSQSRRRHPDAPAISIAAEKRRRLELVGQRSQSTFRLCDLGIGDPGRRSEACQVMKVEWWA
jgi:hypothetical protein